VLAMYADLQSSHTCGHEFIGEVVALGSSYKPNAEGRPKLYSNLKVGDKVVSPFTISCGECQSVKITVIYNTINMLRITFAAYVAWVTQDGAQKVHYSGHQR